MPPTSITPTNSYGSSRERLAHDVRVVLAVDKGDSLHRFDVTSPSMRAVYFSYVFVSVENWMIRSWLVERVLPPDVDVGAVDLDDVVTGPSVTSQPRRRNRAGVDDEQVLEPPRVRHVLVPGEHEVDARALQALERVAGVVDDVALAAGARGPAADGGGATKTRRSAGVANCSSIQP